MADELATEPIEGLEPDWQRFIEERLGHTLDTPTEPEPEEDDDEGVDEGEEEEVEGEEVEGGEGGEGAEGGEPQAFTPPETFPLAPGVDLPYDTARTLYEFDQILRQRPDLQEQVARAMQSGAASQPAPPAQGVPATPAQAPALPEPPSLTDDDLADPSIKALYDYNRALADQLQALNERLNQTSQSFQVRDTQELMAQVATVKSQFATEHELTPDQVEDVAKKADELQVSRMVATAPDRPKAIRDALELAYWSMPEHRTQALESQLKSRSARAKKRQRLAGVGGGGGGQTKHDTVSDPRTMNESDRRRAMALDIAEQTGYSSMETE